MENNKRKLLSALWLCGIVLFLSACTNKQNGFVTGQYYNPTQGTEVVMEDLEETTETVEEQKETLGGDLFLITKNDMQRITIRVNK